MMVAPPVERTLAQLREHYEIERTLADRLRGAAAADRGPLYRTCYDELFRRVPNHPQLVRRADAAAQREAIEPRARLVRHFLRPGGTFAEIGPGDCSLAIDVCRTARQVYAIDVSAEITNRIAPPTNFSLLLSTGTDIPVPPGSVDVAFSYQLIEHLHPSDVEAHARQVLAALRPGGVYVCVTPSRLNGPHDVSRYFDDVATGFHLREYTNGDLTDLFLKAGFTRARPHLGVGNRLVPVPSLPLRLVEGALDRLPGPVRRRLAFAPVLFRLLGVTMVAQK